MIKTIVSITSVLEREIALPIFHDSSITNIISCLNLPKNNHYRQKGFEYLCLDGHRRLASYKVKQISEINIKIPENMNDLILIAKEANKYWIEQFKPTFQENIADIADPKHIEETLKDPYNKANLRQQFIIKNNLFNPYI
ncbi:MAG: hypothetical protein ABIB43_00205 [archaeon]